MGLRTLLLLITSLLNSTTPTTKPPYISPFQSNYVDQNIWRKCTNNKQLRIATSRRLHRAFSREALREGRAWKTKFVNESRHEQVLLMADGVHNAKPKICPNNMVDGDTPYNGSMMVIVKMIKGKKHLRKGTASWNKLKRKEKKIGQQ